jgi:hypothetical protein
MEKTMRWQWGPFVSLLKIKIKEGKKIYGMTQAKIFIHKPK